MANEYDNYDPSSQWNQFNFNPMNGGGQESFNTPQTFQLPANNEFTFGSDAPRGVYQEGANQARPDDISGMSLWDRINFDPNNKVGVDNLFRLGDIGVAGLGAGLQMRDNRNAQKAQERALQYMQSQMNPNANLFSQRLTGMLDNPAGYLNDPVDNEMASQATEGAMRMANRRGSSTLSRDDMLNIQKIKQGSYQQRLKQLSDLYNSANSQNANVSNTMANIMSKAPAGNAQALSSVLGQLYSSGRDIAASSGVASGARQPQYSPQVMQKYNTLTG
jgi:hypothetical protein